MKYAKGTWIDPEECCYPSGSMSAGRRARAICPDGRARIVRIGIPDSFFSIPGSCKAYGRTVSGYITINTDTPNEEYVEFRPNGFGKNYNVFA